jgi:hypothetical protein
MLETRVSWRAGCGKSERPVRGGGNKEAWHAVLIHIKGNLDTEVFRSINFLIPLLYWLLFVDGILTFLLLYRKITI